MSVSEMIREGIESGEVSEDFVKEIAHAHPQTIGNIQGIEVPPECVECVDKVLKALGIDFKKVS